MVHSSTPTGVGLYQRPRCFDALQWSQDNLLAAVTGGQVTVLTPGPPQDPRSCTPAGMLTLPMEEQFSSAEAGPRYRCQQLSQSDKLGNKGYIRALCWSPRGLQSSGECYMSVISSNGSVLCLARDRGSSPLWTVQQDYGADIQTHLSDSAWQAAEQLPMPSEVLHLKGGGSDAAPEELWAAVRVSVEVMNDEEDLRGTWFEGEITAVAPGHALVRYNDLMDGSDDSSKLQEWFPEASLASAAASADFPGPHVRHTLPGFRMRPIPDPEVAGRGQARKVGEAVDVWESQSWLETVVQRVKGRGVHVREVPKRSIPLADVRASLLWTGSAWASRDSPGGCSSSVGAVQLTRLQTDQSCHTGSDTPEDHGGGGAKTDKGSRAGKASGSSSKESKQPKPSSAKEDSLKGSAKARKASVNQLKAALGKPASKAVGSSAKKQSSASIAEQARPSPAQQGQEPASTSKPASKGTAPAAQRRSVGETQPPASSKGTKRASQSTQQAEAGDAAEQPAKKQRKAAVAAPSEPADSAAAEVESATLEGPASSPEQMAWYAQQLCGLVPADWGPVQQLGEVSKAKATNILASHLAQHWLKVREQVPEEEQEQYSGSQHLRNLDVTLLAQLADDLVHSTVAEMERLGVTQAALMKEGRRVIRAALLQQIDPKPAAVPAQQAAEQPGEVDPAVVDGVNCSDKKAAEASVGLVFLLRWLQLHGQVPEEEREVYEKGQHLRNADAAMAEKACNEILHMYEEQLSALGLASKAIMMIGKRTVRQATAKGGASASIPGLMHVPAKVVTEIQEQLGAQFPEMAQRLVTKPLHGHNAEVTIVKSRRSLEQKAASKPSVQAGPLEALPDKEWQRRHDLRTPVSAAWSPSLPASEPHRPGWALLAVGTCAGEVMLWRFVGPAAWDPGGSQKPQAALVARMRISNAWLTAMTFAHWPSPNPGSSGSAVLWLFAADTNGCVHALELNPGRLEAACSSVADGPLSTQALGQCVRNCGPILLPNMRGAHALAAQVFPAGAGSIHIMVAVAQNVGTLRAYCTTAFKPSSSSSSRGSLQAHEGCSAEVQAGTLPITGLAWGSMDACSPEDGSLLISAGADGHLRGWSFQDSQLKPASKDLLRLPTQQPSAPLQGLAISPTGLHCAVSALAPVSDLQITLQSYDKLYQAQVTTHVLVQPSQAGAMALAAVKRLQQQPTPLHCQLWDVAHLLRWHAGLGTSNCFSSPTPEITAVMDHLEQAAGSPDEAVSTPLQRHSLQMASALRQWLHPAPQLRPMAGIKRWWTQLGAAPPPEDSATSADWQTSLDSHRLRVLLSHLRSLLAPDSGSSPLTRHLAAELAAGREDEMPADILELARSQSHGLPPDLTQESLPGVGSAGFPVGPLLSAASKATADVQGTMMSWPRCASTLEACARRAHWACLLCGSVYLEVAAGFFSPICMYCGTALGQPHLPGTVQPGSALL